MLMKLTAIIEESSDGWYVGQIEEFPAALSQAKTIEDLKSSLLDALKLLLENNKETTRKSYQGKEVIREELILA